MTNATATAPVDPRNDPANRRPNCAGGMWCRCAVSTPCYPTRQTTPESSHR